MRRFALLLLTTIASMLTVSAQSWSVDTLGGDFQVRYFDQGSDYSGQVRSSVVRLLPDSAATAAVLYVHGFNDYFFQSEMAHKFVDHGYGFYAVDLRKYGRSLLPGQKRCQVRSFNEYIPDIDSAISVVKTDGFDRLILMGHSTGGLVVSYYMERAADPIVEAVILNSPFLDWNLGKIECAVGAVSFVGSIIPGIAVSPGSSTAYGRSLNAAYDGEWTYNTDWKSISSPKVDTGWIHAISSAQRYLRRHKYAIKVPILLLYSARSVGENDADQGDAVLDVADIRKYGMMLGHDVTAIKVDGGLHDLILSKPSVRYPLYNYIFSWLGRL